MTEQNDFFNGAGSASARGGSPKFAPGIYPAIRIDNLKVRSGFHGLRFILEGEVVEPGRERTPGEAPSPVGSKGSWGVQIDGKHGAIGLGEAKAVIGLLHGMTPAEADAMGDAIKPLMHAAIAADQPFKGRILSTECWKHKTGNDQTMIKHFWDLPKNASATAPAPAVPAVVPAPAPAPAAPAVETPATAPGGPWYAIANDPRGTHYNAQYEFRTFA